jgi:Fe-S-cluster containining protein
LFLSAANCQRQVLLPHPAGTRATLARRREIFLTSNREDVQMVPVQIELTVAGKRLRAGVPVPPGVVDPVRLLPVLQSLADTMVELSVRAAAERGRPLACRAGCGACCRQLVPISRIEARRIAEVVDALPEPRRSTVRKRFADAIEALRSAGLLDRLRNPETIDDQEISALGEQYFRLGIPCPLLEDESCSIYADRPLICRQYIVSSDPVHCQDLTARNVQRINVPGRLGAVAARWDHQMNRSASSQDTDVPWLPLVLALQFADSRGNDEPALTGPQQIQAMMSALTDAKPDEVVARPDRVAAAPEQP